MTKEHRITLDPGSGVHGLVVRVYCERSKAAGEVCRPIVEIVVKNKGSKPDGGQNE